MQQNERKPSRTRSPRGRSPSGRMSRWLCKDYFGGTCNNSFCEKWHPPECLFYKTKSGCRFGEKCSFAHRQVDAQPTKRSEKNDDKSAVAILKKGDWQERGPVTDQCHDRRVKLDKRSDKKLGQKSSKRRSSDARQLGCVFQDMTPPKSFLRKCTDMRKPIQRVKFTKLLLGTLKYETKIFRLDIFAQVNLMSVGPTLQNLRIGLWRRQSGKSKRCTRSSVEAGQKCVQIKGAWKQYSSHFRKIGASLHQLLNLRNETLLSTPERQCTWSAKQDLSFAEVDTLTKSCSANAWRGNCVF